MNSLYNDEGNDFAEVVILLDAYETCQLGETTSLLPFVTLFFLYYNFIQFVFFLSSPGDKLCSTEDCIPGTGVYLRHGYIYSSLAGYVLRKNEGEEVGESCIRHAGENLDVRQHL